LRDGEGDYMPPYFYLLSLASFFPIKNIYGVKIISCIADMVLAFYVMRIVDLKYAKK
jgi:Gpi18-like mannosyltransferase